MDGQDGEEAQTGGTGQGREQGVIARNRIAHRHRIESLA